jgi:Flp pilus assembly CpaF family ATPase
MIAPNGIGPRGVARWSPEGSGAAPLDLVADLARRVSEVLADERVRRRADGIVALSASEERDLARREVLAELDRLAAAALSSGGAPLEPTDEEALADAVMDAVLGLGRIQPLLDDPDVSDIHIRGCDSVWVKLRDGTRMPADPVVGSDQELVELVRRVAARMGRSERRFDAAHPELNVQLPDGSRLFATMEVSARPSVIIRRHRFELSSLDELADHGLLDDRLQAFLAAAVRARRNIVIAGGTGSGKTTLLRALLNEVPRHERIVTIEDAYELGIDRFPDLHPDHDMLQARPANIEGQGEISMLDLTKMALRMDPDRVVVGEVRGSEAFPMLMAMSQGNNGSMCTIHADSTRTVFPKLAAYVAMAGTGLPVETVNLLIATAVHFVVHIEQVHGVRRLVSVREVVDADGPQVVSNEVFVAEGDGCAVPGYPLRDQTLALLETHGFDARLLDRYVRSW